MSGSKTFFIQSNNKNKYALIQYKSYTSFSCEGGILIDSRIPAAPGETINIQKSFTIKNVFEPDIKNQMIILDSRIPAAPLERHVFMT